MDRFIIYNMYKFVFWLAKVVEPNNIPNLCYASSTHICI